MQRQFSAALAVFVLAAAVLFTPASWASDPSHEPHANEHAHHHGEDGHVSEHQHHHGDDGHKTEHEHHHLEGVDDEDHHHHAEDI